MCTDYDRKKPDFDEETSFLTGLYFNTPVTGQEPLNVGWHPDYGKQGKPPAGDYQLLLSVSQALESDFLLEKN
jgi:hypothetical protein